MASTDKGDGETPPAEEEKGLSPPVDRDGVRGLGEQLLLTNAHIASRCHHDQKRCVWSQLFSSLVPADDSLMEMGLSFNDVTSLLGHGEQLIDMVIRRASPKEWTEWRHASLVLAAEAGNSNIFCKVLSFGRECMAAYAPSLMHAAAQGGSDVILSVLLDPDAGSGFEQVDKLSAAVKILATGIDRNYGTTSPLQTAAIEGHSGFVARLVAAGAPLEYKGMLGRTALTLAVEKGHTDVVVQLLARGANPNNVNDLSTAAAIFHRVVKFPGYTPLCIAASEDHGDIVQALLGAGATLRTGRGAPFPLHIAAHAGACRPIAQLLQAGADVNEVDARRRTPLHHACASVGWVETAKYMGAIDQLLDHGAEVDVLDASDRTPLYYAFVSRVTDIVLDNRPIDRLLQAGANVGIVDARGRSPLHWASCTNRREAVKSLLRLNADETLLDNHGETAQDMIADYLLGQLQIDENQDGHYRTLSAEQINNMQEIRHMLERAPADRAWYRRGWLVMMRAHQRIRSLDERSDVISRAVPTVTVADDSVLGVVPKLIEEETTDADVGVKSCLYEAVMWTVRRSMEGGLFNEVVMFL